MTNLHASTGAGAAPAAQTVTLWPDGLRHRQIALWRALKRIEALRDQMIAKTDRLDTLGGNIVALLDELEGDADLEVEPDREPQGDDEPQEAQTCPWPDEGDQTAPVGYRLVRLAGGGDTFVPAWR